METSSKVDMLIVGAGPTGLTLAAALSKLGVRNRIIDKTNPALTNQKRLAFKPEPLNPSMNS